jgi:hypothetical protein
LVNSRLSPFVAATPGVCCKSSHPPVAPLLPKLRGQFAEFLDRGSPVHLPRLLGTHLRRFAVRAFRALPRGFSWRSRGRGLHLSFKRLGPLLTVPVWARIGGFATRHSAEKGHAPCPIGTLSLPPRVPPSVKRARSGAGLVTSCPSPTPRGLGLGPTNPEWIILPQEPLGFRWRGFSPRIALLIPAFALPPAPAVLPVDLHC